MIFKKRRYPLPRFPHNVAREFKLYCEVLPDERVLEFIPEVSEVVAHFHELSEQHPLLDIERVDEIGRMCTELLQTYPNCKPAHKRMIVGAVRYFASTDDPMSETSFASGLDDDVRVLNHVAEELGRDDLYLEE
ncbi:MAG: hypothetical protein KDD70_04230 [Bdellovibrionales bacterium]|nr:hypothetical protein [Bdellovibrionales bacterium]